MLIQALLAWISFGWVIKIPLTRDCIYWHWLWAPWLRAKTNQNPFLQILRDLEESVRWHDLETTRGDWWSWRWPYFSYWMMLIQYQVDRVSLGWSHSWGGEHSYVHLQTPMLSQLFLNMSNENFLGILKKAFVLEWLRLVITPVVIRDWKAAFTCCHFTLGFTTSGWWSPLPITTALWGNRSRIRCTVMCIKLWASRLHIIPQNSVDVASAAAEWEHAKPHMALGHFIEGQIFGPWPFIAPITQCAFPHVSINDPTNDTRGYLLCVVARRLRVLKTTMRSLTGVSCFLPHIMAQ